MEESKVKPKNTVKEIKEILDSIDFKINNTSLIQDNKIMFTFNEKLYRCKMPNQRERSLAEDFKNKFYTKLISEGGYLTKKQLKKLLKEHQDIDIDVLETKKVELQGKIKDNYMDLVLHLDSEVTKIEEIKEKIAQIENQHFDVCIEVANHLSPSIEDRIDKEYVEYLCYLCTEVPQEGSPDTWGQVWKSYNDFQDDNTKLPNKSAEILAYLLMNTRE